MTVPAQPMVIVRHAEREDGWMSDTGDIKHGEPTTSDEWAVYQCANGRVRIAIPGVKVTVTCGSGAALTNLSDEKGRVHFVKVPIGSCSLATDVQGFRSVLTAFEVAASEPINLSLSLEPEPMYTGLMVTGPSLEGSATTVTSDSRPQRSTCDRPPEPR